MPGTHGLTETDVATSPEASPEATQPILSITDLTLGVKRGNSTTSIVDGVSFDVAPGDRFGLVGESGSGKSMTLRAIAGLLPGGVEVLSGHAYFRGVDLFSLSAEDRRALMGPQIAMVFQEPMTALNPVMRVGEQIAEGSRRHLGLSRKAAMGLAVDMMAKTGIPDPIRRARAYPHELSGGLRQRIMIAMALSCRPKLLLCDEPMTALDVTVQHQVLNLLEELCDDFDASLLFVTHDLAVVNQTCSELAVMYSGRIVEFGTVASVLQNPRHPYTKGLLDSAPDFDQPDRALIPIPGFPPHLADKTPGCSFAPRCSFATEACLTGTPPLTTVRPTTMQPTTVQPGAGVACYRSDEIAEGVLA
ncbi:ABC transporter ATP-binding protein [Glaciibacter superstes]|uniref:ABC transporter ATP-binding protein n=1 Tax=Glaciibacter superstes TaxID=501023 RepID=UPI000A05AFC4|nr:ABC transporter ATP-binding protein [Glaciibacter superstes]